MKIIVNKECINKARRKSKYDCPVALTIQKIYPYKPVSVCPSTISPFGKIGRCGCGVTLFIPDAVVEIPLKNGNRITLKLPEHIKSKLSLWDEDGEIEPFRFELPELDKYLKRSKNVK